LSSEVGYMAGAGAGTGDRYRSDIFSAGAILYEMLSGKRLPGGLRRGHDVGDPAEDADSR
jgi:hypothetical protein